MSASDRVKVGATAAFDRIANTVFSSALSVGVLPFGYGPGKLAQWRRERHIYEDAAASGDAQRFFRPPHHEGIVKHSRARGLHFRPRNGVCEVLSFASPYQPLSDRIAARFGRYRRNRTGYAMYWRHSSGPRPTIIGIHGFSADPFLLNQLFFALPWFYSIGCDVVLVTMPFHGRRKPLTSGFSGRHFFAGGPAHINEAFGQTICDIRVIVRHLVDELKVPKLGVTGISLGGLTAATLAAVEERLYFSIPNVPVVSLGDLLLEWHPISELVRMRLMTAGLGIRDLRRAFAVISPLSYPALVPREHLMIIAGAADRMAPPKQSRLLWDHWDRCPIHWFPGNHVLHLDRGNYLREMARFMNRIGFLQDSRELDQAMSA